MSSLLNPALIFTLVWGIPLFVIMNIEVAGFIIRHDDPVIAFIALNFIMIIICHSINLFIFSGRKKRKVLPFLNEKMLDNLQRYAIKIFYLWGIGYVVVICYSGGFPLIWVLIGDARTYVDFGAPTLSGLLNMLRAFSCTLMFFIILKSDQRRWKLKFFLLIFVGSSFFVELARGNGTFLVAHLIGMYLLVNKLSLWKFLVMTVFALFFLFVGSFLNAFRYGEGFQYLFLQSENYGLTALSNSLLFVLFVPVFAYMCLPIVNLNLKLTYLPELQFQLYYLLQGVVPTVVRNFLYESKDYGLLIDPAHNVSSFFDPIIRDLGTSFSLGFMPFFYFIISFMYFKAKHGNLFYFFLYPAIFASTVLSFFSMYFTLLVVLLYPIPVYYLVKRLEKFSRVNEEKQSYGNTSRDR